MELKDTVDGMTSADYKERFKAEYRQTLIRLDELRETIEPPEADELDFKPAGLPLILKAQLAAMENYLGIMQFRALIEQIEVEEE